MTNTGKTIAKILSVCLALYLLTMGSMARAALIASVDRQQLALGDTVRLELSATEEEDLNTIALDKLTADFEILQRSSKSSMQIINGQRSHSRQLIIDLAPLREGQLTIPALGDGNSTSRPLSITVSAAPQAPAADSQVIFEAEVDHNSVYVQGQIVLTLRIQQAINLESRSISELKLDHAFIRPFEQQSYQRTMAGKTWLVNEIRYAIFPEQSGKLTIPAQAFSAHERLSQRSIFDRSSGRRLHRVSQPIDIEVLPRPTSYPANATWLPATHLKIEEQWSQVPDSLHVGESATRTIRISAEGLQGAQLPPVLAAATNGLKFYPDQPQISENESAGTLIASRSDSAALVPSRSGSYELPEIRIPWWDTGSNELREAIIPARTITVKAAAGVSNSTTTMTDIAIQNPATVTGLSYDDEADAHQLQLWRGVAGLCALGWILTALWARHRLFIKDRHNNHIEDNPGNASKNTNEKIAYKNLLAACATHQAGIAREALLKWGHSLYPDSQNLSLEAFIIHTDNDAAFKQAIDELNRALYTDNTATWQGSALAVCAKNLHDSLHKKNPAAQKQALSLYPQPLR